MKKTLQRCLLIFALMPGTAVLAQQMPLSRQMAATVMDIWKDSLVMEPGKPVKWTYDQGVILEGMEAIWKATGDGSYFRYIQQSMDHFIDQQGNIRTYRKDNYNIDNIKNGRSLLMLYKVTGQEKYFKAATLLWDQLAAQPRTKEGGFWHKKIYPNQMWLDGLYMAQPFYTTYAALISDQKAFSDIARQFIFMEKHARDPNTGLLYHGWEETREQKWADPATGRSPHVWGRAMGWYAMALVDVLDDFPLNHPERAELVAILQRLAAAVIRYQDPSTGLWYDIMDAGSAKGNYLESSASCMFVYALQKGVDQGNLPETYAGVAKKGYAGIQQVFIEQRAADAVNLKGTVTVSGLGGTPYRDGSFDYYISEKVITNDPKGVGAFLLASSVMEQAAQPKPGRNKTVMLDCFFNSETKPDLNGNPIKWHYTWTERGNGGFSLWGDTFRSRGFRLDNLNASPTAKNLSGASVYIIADPDIPKENPKPNYVSKKDIREIREWVKGGGVLVLMANDTGNAELKHFNELAAVFSMQFNDDSRGRVKGRQFETGSVQIPPSHEVLPHTQQIYVKEYSSLTVRPPAKSVLQDREGFTVMAVSSYGKGTVFAIGDPWLYNEYTDGRKLPRAYENYQAAMDFTDWLSAKIPAAFR